jgi:hypothetical protein
MGRRLKCHTGIADLLVVLLRGIAHLVAPESGHLFHRRASVPEAAKLGSRQHLAFDPRVCQTGGKTERLNKTREW